MRMLLAAAYLCSPLLLGGCIVDDRGPHDHEYHDHDHEHYDHDHDHDRFEPR